MSDHRCPVCARLIEPGKFQTITINPQEVTNEQVADAYKVAKEQEAAERSSERLRALYASSAGARISAHGGRAVPGVIDAETEDELVALGRALHALGAEIYVVHPECLTSEAFKVWFQRKTGGLLGPGQTGKALADHLERFRDDLGR